MPRRKVSTISMAEREGYRPTASSACLREKYLRCFSRCTSLRRTLDMFCLRKTRGLKPDLIMKIDDHKVVNFHGGEGGIRTLDELPHTRFRVVRLQPLGHLSLDYWIGQYRYAPSLAHCLESKLSDNFTALANHSCTSPATL